MEIYELRPYEYFYERQRKGKDFLLKFEAYTELHQGNHPLTSGVVFRTTKQLPQYQPQYLALCER